MTGYTRMQAYFAFCIAVAFIAGLLMGAVLL